MPFLTVLIVVGSTEYRSIANGKGLAFKPVLAGFLLGGFLFVLQDVNPSVTSKLGVLIIIVSLVSLFAGPVKIVTGNKVTGPKPKKLV